MTNPGTGRSDRFLLDDLMHYVEQGRPSPGRQHQLGRAASHGVDPVLAVGTRSATGLCGRRCRADALFSLTVSVRPAAGGWVYRGTQVA